jgi:hypothetical protein
MAEVRAQGLEVLLGTCWLGGTLLPPLDLRSWLFD